MKFEDVVDHLRHRGFVTRKQWDKKCYIHFGMDNALWMIREVCPENSAEVKRHQRFWHPCLADIVADDWKMPAIWWTSSKDDFLPFVAEKEQKQCAG